MNDMDSPESLNSLFIEPVNRDQTGVKALAIAVLDMSLRDLFYVYHTGKLQGTGRQFGKHNLVGLRSSEPYRFFTEPSMIRDFWCMAAGMDAEAIGEWIMFHCSDLTRMEQFSRKFTHKNVGKSLIKHSQS